MKVPMHSVTRCARRRFLEQAVTYGSAVVLLPNLRGAKATPATTPRRYRAAVIGHTGHGDYGHGLDVVFNDHPAIDVIAVADPDETGRAQAAARCHARQADADFRQMLDRERPQLVAVGPRHTDERFAMVSAALRAGSHVLSEKPFTQTLREADELLALARKDGLRIAVAHQMRLSPSIVHLKARLDAGLIGPLRSLHGHGKQDGRAGGEDLLVLGTHVFDLMRLFAGEVVWCAAIIRQQGREITRADAHPATERIGPVVGDEIEAQFAFAGGATGTFTSRAALRQTLGHWGLTLLGEQGAVRILMDMAPRILLRKGGPPDTPGAADDWRPLPGDPMAEASPVERSFAAANRRVLDDWLRAIAEQREATCSGAAGMKALEMAVGVTTAGLTRGRVSFPLAHREHPLSP